MTSPSIRSVPRVAGAAGQGESLPTSAPSRQEQTRDHVWLGGPTPDAAGHLTSRGRLDGGQPLVLADGCAGGDAGSEEP